MSITEPITHPETAARSAGTGGISADDPDAVEKLKKKLEGLQAAQDTMRAANAYYRKHKTLDGCTALSPENIAKLKSSMAENRRLEDKPFLSWQLSNNGAEIRRVKARIEQLTRQRATGYVGWEFDGGTVEANQDNNRLQVFFDQKPGEDVRAELKANGFHWSPRAGAWQRQLNDNAIRAAGYVKAIWPVSGEHPRDLQRKGAG